MFASVMASYSPAEAFREAVVGGEIVASGRSPDRTAKSVAEHLWAGRYCASTRLLSEVTYLRSYRRVVVVCHNTNKTPQLSISGLKLPFEVFYLRAAKVLTSWIFLDMR